LAKTTTSDTGSYVCVYIHIIWMGCTQYTTRAIMDPFIQVPPAALVVGPTIVWVKQ
jgi:hypothetical protein